MRQFLLGMTGCCALAGTALANPSPPPPVSVSTTVVATGGGTVTKNLGVHGVGAVGGISLGASISMKPTIGISSSISVGFTTP